MIDFERKMAMDKQTITIYDVAREAGVSMATVSRVVNGNPNVKPATRKKVSDVIDQLDYRPNAVARGLASKKTTTVGVLIPDVTDTYYSSLARGIDDIATMYKYNIILANSDDNSEKELNVLNNLLAKQVDGIIFMGSKLLDEVYDEFRRSKTPFVLAGSIDPKDRVPNVNIDYKVAMKESVNQLIDAGNKKIAFIFRSKENPIDGYERLDGYKEALAEANLPFDEDLVIPAANSYKEGEKICQRLLELDATAAITASDEVAVGLLNALKDRKVSIPDQFEIITSNNSKLVEMTRPKISTAVQPLYDIGAVSMRLLTKLMNKEEAVQNTVRLPHHINLGGTTKNNKA